MKFCGPCVAGRCIPPRQGITPADGPPGCGGSIPGGIIPVVIPGPSPVVICGGIGLGGIIVGGAIVGGIMPTPAGGRGPGGRDPGPVVIIPGAPVAGNPARRPNMFCGGIMGVGCICVVIMVFNPRRNVRVSRFAASVVSSALPALQKSERERRHHPGNPSRRRVSSGAFS
jgi:hypothetical protein